MSNLKLTDIVVAPATAAHALFAGLFGRWRQPELAYPGKLIVREVDIPAALQLAGPIPPAGLELTGSFRATNKGKVDNVIRVLEAVIVAAPRPPPADRETHFDQSAGVGVSKLRAGRTGLFDIPRPLKLDKVAAGRIVHKLDQLFVLGKIVYEDEVGHLRRTGFAHQFNLATRRFESRPDDDDVD